MKLTKIFRASLLLTVACSSSSETSTSPYKTEHATCNACLGASYTPADCSAAGAVASCESSEFVASVPGCTNGCTFARCRGVPACPAKDAGSAPRDPLCTQADNDTVGRGLFPSPPPCANPGKSTINGSVRYTCPCSSNCPCGYQCGSIPLKVGGTIGSVCAPP